MDPKHYYSPCDDLISEDDQYHCKIELESNLLFNIQTSSKYMDMEDFIISIPPKDTSDIEVFVNTSRMDCQNGLDGLYIDDVANILYSMSTDYKGKSVEYISKLYDISPDILNAFFSNTYKNNKLNIYLGNVKFFECNQKPYITIADILYNKIVNGNYQNDINNLNFVPKQNNNKIYGGILIGIIIFLIIIFTIIKINL